MMVFDDYIAEVIYELGVLGYSGDCWPEDIEDYYDNGDDPHSAAVNFLEEFNSRQEFI